MKIVQFPELPEHGDVSDWLDLGHTSEDLIGRVVQASEFMPQSDNFGIKLTSVKDLLREAVEVTDYLVDGVLPSGGLSLLAAKPKVGKSTLAQNLAVRVARGDCFLGRMTSQGPVVYLAMEEKRSELADHFRRLEVDAEPIFVHTGSMPEEALATLREAVMAKSGRLAIVDTLFKLVRIRDGNDYAEVTRKLEPLLSLARETGCHILCTHHLGKGEREGGDGILGSTALFAAVDTALIMKRKGEERIIESQQRYGTDIPKTVLSFNPDTLEISVAGELEVMEVERAGKAIIEALDSGPMTQGDIRDIEGFRTAYLRKAQTNLYEAGSITRTGKGRKNDPYIYEKAVSENVKIMDESKELGEPESMASPTNGSADTNSSSGGSQYIYGNQNTGNWRTKL